MPRAKKGQLPFEGDNPKDKTVVLTRKERLVILNSIEYMVQGGVTAFPFRLYKSIWKELKDEQDNSFPDVER